MSDDLLLYFNFEPVDGWMGVDFGKGADSTGYWHAEVFPDGRIKTIQFHPPYLVSQLKRIEGKIRKARRYRRMMERRGLLAKKKPRHGNQIGYLGNVGGVNADPDMV